MLLFIVTYSYPIIHCCTIIIITMSYHVISPQLTVQCHSQKKTAPCEMSSGSAVVDLNIVYCSPYDSNSVYRYQLMEDQWNDLPLCQYRDSGLVVIDGVLTVVGVWMGFPSSTSAALNSCHPLWAASDHRWWARRVISQLHSPASGWTVGEHWLYV